MSITVRQLVDMLVYMDPDTEVMVSLNFDPLCSEPQMIRSISQVDRVTSEFSPMLNQHVAVQASNLNAALSRGATGVVLIS
jgi:hypothetical protein